MPGALLRFAFAGESLTYVHTNATNGAIVELSIDGVIHEIDCYSPTVQWQAHSEFAHLGSGPHVVTLRSTGRANPSSQGKFIYLGAFIVK